MTLPKRLLPMCPTSSSLWFQYSSTSGFHDRGQSFPPSRSGFLLQFGVLLSKLFTSSSSDGISMASLFKVVLTPTFSLCHYPVHFPLNCLFIRLLQQIALKLSGLKQKQSFYYIAKFLWDRSWGKAWLGGFCLESVMQLQSGGGWSGNGMGLEQLAWLDITLIHVAPQSLQVG